MSVLICGSLAFDTISTFDGRFAQQILPDQLHILNVSFLVPTLKREFGGVAGNIAYGLQQLGGKPLVMAALGVDGAPYRDRMQQWGISLEHVLTVTDSHTAQAIIITDKDNNQITAFHPGAMQYAAQLKIKPDPKVQLAIIGPDGRDAMIQHAEQLAAAKIPFVFDPGQGLPMFDGDDLKRFVSQASWVAVNDYEGKMLADRTGQSLADISKSHLKGLIETLGAEGCNVYIQGEKTHVAGVKAAAVVDPTGCGDAFRGGLLYGLSNGWDLVKSVGLANRMGALKIAVSGPQNYTVDRAALLAG
ncbi:carbohydrate kinase family protein [Aquabacterium sp. CECT 9606]|uniref:carbohydrate kinase family protein n=1 Tax=Aquabacterium sp. CECT 9606 TaxID=2845822 RepID=UPI001E620626|nr:carbohydrate kinase family protein [Aquabacterium sp. CECT 9606]CAH0351691.1 Adenosine kinase [Aquabacterium sp. CECT 9606]